MHHHTFPKFQAFHFLFLFNFKLTVSQMYPENVPTLIHTQMQLGPMQVCVLDKN